MPIPPPNPPLPPLRVLIADDMPQVLHDLRQLLELSGGMEIVAEAHCGEDAVRLAEELQPDVVVMDLGMPGMDGCEATRQIKARHLAQRVVMLSVHADPKNKERARAVGADEFLVKGCAYEILVNAILGKGGSTKSIEVNKGAK
jgi:DNA-binding NarL/FixJ family response regulator